MSKYFLLWSILCVARFTSYANDIDAAKLLAKEWFLPSPRIFHFNYFLEPMFL
jgi:hypothetical protein